MTRKHLFLLMFHACFAMLAVGQQYSPNNLYGVSMPRGLFMTSLGIPQDTASLDPYAKMYPHIAIKNNVFYGWSVPDQKWKPVVSGASASEVDPVYTANGVPKTRHIVINGEDHTLDADANFTVTNGPETDPLYTANGVPKSRMIFINGEGHDLTSNPAFTVVSSPSTRWYNTLPGTALGDATANFESIINFNDVASGLYFVSDTMRYSSPTTTRGLSSVYKHGLDAVQWVMRDTEGTGASQNIRYHFATIYDDNFTLLYENDYNGGANHISQTFINGDGEFQADGTTWPEGGVQGSYGLDMNVNGGAPTVSLYSTDDNSQSWEGSWLRMWPNLMEIKSPSIQLRDYSPADGSALYYFTLSNTDGLVFHNTIATDRGGSSNYDFTMGASQFQMHTDVGTTMYSTITGSSGGDIVEDFTSTFWLKYAGVNTLYAGVDGVKIETAFALDGIDDATDLTGKKVLVRDETTGNVTKVDASALGGGGSTDIYSDYRATDNSTWGDAPGSYMTRILRIRDTSQGDIMISDTMYNHSNDATYGEHRQTIFTRNYSGITFSTIDTSNGSDPSQYKYIQSFANINADGFGSGAQYTTQTGQMFSNNFYSNPSQTQIEMSYDSTLVGIHFEAGASGQFMRFNLQTATGLPGVTTTQVELFRDSILLQSQFVDIHGTLRFNTQQSAPTSSGDTSGTPGEMRLAPTGELYVKTGTGWLKFTGATF